MEGEVQGVKGKDKNVKTINEWLDRDDLPEGYTIMNAKFRRDFNRLAKALSCQAKYLYILGVDMEARYVTKMMWSAKRQSSFCRSVAASLREKRVEREHIAIFQKTVNRIERRLETIERITREDIHLTKYEPFFMAEIYGKELKDIDFDDLKETADAWISSHKDEVEKHMKEIEPELERYEAFKARKRNSIKAEKDAKRQKKKDETAYIKELRENAKKHKAEQKRLDKSFEVYYK